MSTMTTSGSSTTSGASPNPTAPAGASSPGSPPALSPPTVPMSRFVAIVTTSTEPVVVELHGRPLGTWVPFGRTLEDVALPEVVGLDGLDLDALEASIADRRPWRVTHLAQPVEVEAAWAGMTASTALAEIAEIVGRLTGRPVDPAKRHEARRRTRRYLELRVQQERAATKTEGGPR